MTDSKLARVGIIAEDSSDVEAIKTLVRRISVRKNIGFKKFVGQGCGRIKRKCYAWAENLKDRGCKYLVLVHDLDRDDLDDLKISLENCIATCPIEKYLICIPVEEIEAWWLSDPGAIASALNLDKAPRVKGNPESISSPKEYISELVRRVSKGSTLYINTKHNETIAKNLDLSRAKNCASFVPFYNFVIEHLK